MAGTKNDELIDSWIRHTYPSTYVSRLIATVAGSYSIHSVDAATISNR